MKCFLPHANRFSSLCTKKRRIERERESCREEKSSKKRRTLSCQQAVSLLATTLRTFLRKFKQTLPKQSFRHNICIKIQSVYLSIFLSFHLSPPVSSLSLCHSVLISFCLCVLISLRLSFRIVFVFLFFCLHAFLSFYLLSLFLPFFLYVF